MKPRLRWAEYFGPAVFLAYQAGLAQGELRGRLLLAHELEVMFPEHKDGMNAEDAARIRLRQVH